MQTWYAWVALAIATIELMHLTRAISFAGLRTQDDAPWSGSPRELFNWAVSIGARGVVLDVTAPGFRPRELDASAKRDVIAVIRRSGLELRGLDAFVPPSHFKDPIHMDRAVGAAVQAMEMAAELGRLSGTSVPVCTSLPTDVAADVIARLCEAASKADVALADCSWPSRDGLPRPELGVDPATIIAAGANPIDVVIKSVRPIAVARISDMSSIGRCAPGAGKLDPLGYEVALVTVGYVGSLVLDLRGMSCQSQIAAASLEIR